MIFEEINITDAEYEVMKVIWTLGESSSREVSEILEEKMDWKSTTVKTLLARLVEKNMLKTTKEKNKYIYRAEISEIKAATHLVDDFDNKVCNKIVGSLLLEILEEKDLSSEDIDKLKEMLDKKVPNDHIKCNCLEGSCNCPDGACDCKK